MQERNWVGSVEYSVHEVVNDRDNLRNELDNLNLMYKFKQGIFKFLVFET